jgi:hypothetical protein
MNRNIIFKTILFITIVCFALPDRAAAQDHSMAFSAADTSKFSVNKNDDWKLFNSYVSTYKKDSAQIELIIQHANNIDLKKEQYIGKIKHQALSPHTEQNLWFSLLNDSYVLRIDTNGKCYLKFMYGTVLSVDPIIIPLKVFYKL